MITFENVTKSYGNGAPALSNLNIEIEDGEFVFVVGTSGSGKSTFIKLLLKELEPTEGKIIVNDTELRKLRSGKTAKYRRKVGVVFQDFRLLKDRNVYENIAFAQRVIGVSTREIKKNVPRMLSLVGLSEKYKSFPNELSGGEQQRVGILRAIIANPHILLMDEPFSALDPISRKQLQNLTLSLQKELGMTVVFVTHDIEEAKKLADRIAIFQKGRIIQLASPKDMAQNPVNDFVADLFGGDN